MQSAEARTAAEWPALFDALAPRLKQMHGFRDDVLRNTRSNLVNGIPILVLDALQNFEIAFASKGLQATVGWKADAIVGKRSLEFLRLKPDTMHDMLNQRAWAEMDCLKKRVLRHVVGAPYPEAYIGLVVSSAADGLPFWNLMDVAPLETSPGGRCRYLAFVLLRIEAPVPKAIFHEGYIDTELASALVETARSDLSLARRNNRVGTGGGGGAGGVTTDPGTAPPAPGEEDGEEPQQQNDLAGTLLQAAEAVRKALVHIHEDAQEGYHYVPKLGWASVEAFDRLNMFGRGRAAHGIPEEIFAAWQGSEEDATHSASDGPAQLACLVGDPTGVDCPIVFASEGFEVLTGYKRLWALGRNCRFLQPNAQRTNMSFNRSEFRRLRDFCKNKKAKCMLSLLLNERADGRHFWNLLYLQHIHLNGNDNGGAKQANYIFGTLTSATVQKDALDMIVLQELGGQGAGEKALQVLRDKLREREEHFRPSKQCLRACMAEVSLAWVREAGRGVASFWERSLFVPRVGVGAALDFSGVWQQLVDAHAVKLQEQLGLSDEALNSLRANKEMTAVCVVSDPLAMDCPLVFLSRAFQEATGYDAAFALGRNCRFLQPSTTGMNEAVNGEELASIREFCALRGQQAVNKPPFVALLLNQKRTGERFWNLLHLNHIMVANRPYILGTYTLLMGVPMPGLIKDAPSSEAVLHHDEAQMMEFNVNLGGFCAGLRQELRELRAQMVGACTQDEFDDDSTGEMPSGTTLSDEGGAEVVEQLAKHAAQALKGYLQSCRPATPPESPCDLPVSLVGPFDAAAWTKALEELKHTSRLYGLFLRETSGGMPNGVGGAGSVTAATSAAGGGYPATAGCRTPAARPQPGGVGGAVPRSAASLVDPAVEDCPLVYVSAEFEAITGYTRQTAVGLNCRFLQPKDADVNNLLNRGELERVRDFCRGGGGSRGRGRGSTTAEEGAAPRLLVALLVNMERDQYPFWNLVALEKVTAEGRPYILAVQTRVELEMSRLAELLAMDADAILELDRLRRCVKQRESSLLEMGPTALVGDAISEWLASFPPYFELPLLESGGPALGRPSVSLELNARSDLPKIFLGALEEGIRHFHLSFEGDIQACGDDHRVSGLTGQLFALRLADLMVSGANWRFDFLRAGIRFTIVTPPSFVHTFAELHKVLRQCRYEIDCWMLDCRGASVQQVRDAWQAMSRSVRVGEVASLGLWAISRQARDAIARMPGAERVSVASFEMRVGKALDSAKLRLLQELRSQGVEVEAYGIYGPTQSLLNSPTVQEQAAVLGMDPAMLLMKWAEAQDCTSVVPQLRTDARATDEAPSKVGTGSGSSSATEKDNKEELQPLSIHRNFVREYRNSRPAQDCAVALETSLGVKEFPPDLAAALAPVSRTSVRQSSAPPSAQNADLPFARGHKRRNSERAFTEQEREASVSLPPVPLEGEAKREDDSADSCLPQNGGATSCAVIGLGPAVTVVDGATSGFVRQQARCAATTSCLEQMERGFTHARNGTANAETGSVSGPDGTDSPVVASQRAPIGKAEAATQTPTQLYLSAVDAAGDVAPAAPAAAAPSAGGEVSQPQPAAAAAAAATAAVAAAAAAAEPSPEAPASTAEALARSAMEDAQTPLPISSTAVSKAVMKLWERGWTLQAIAELFDLDEPTVAQQIARH